MTIDSSASSRLVYGRDDALFGHLEAQQEGLPWGNVLDAGTGLHSLRWLATLDTHHVTAVTADRAMQSNCQAEVDALVENSTETYTVHIGNWFDAANPLLLPEESFDVILCDYLIGAMDGFSPYHQDQMIPKLVKLLKPGTGRLYIIGLQPIPTDTPSLLSRVVRVRDACILLAGHLCYREYPVHWIERQVEAHEDLEQVGIPVEFPIRYRAATIIKQIQVGRKKFKFFPTDALRSAMAEQLDELEAEAHHVAPMTFGLDYVVTAQRRERSKVEEK